jgi:hypothetical protein
VFESAIRADAERRRERARPVVAEPKQRAGCGPSVRIMVVSLLGQLIRGL